MRFLVGALTDSLQPCLGSRCTSTAAVISLHGSMPLSQKTQTMTQALPPSKGMCQIMETAVLPGTSRAVQCWPCKAQGCIKASAQISSKFRFEQNRLGGLRLALCSCCSQQENCLYFLWAAATLQWLVAICYQFLAGVPCIKETLAAHFLHVIAQGTCLA